MAVDPGIDRELDGLCALASIYLNPAEKEQIARQLNALVKVLNQIQKVDTSGVEPAVHPVQLPARFREDEVEPSLHPEIVFRNTANRSGHFFLVPRITEDDSDGI